MFRRRQAEPVRLRWQENPQLSLLVCLLGPVVDLRAGLPHENLVALFRGYDTSVRGRVADVVSEPGFVLDLPPVPGAVESLRELVETRDSFGLVAPASAPWAPCRADFYVWVERHVGAAASEVLILAEHRTRLVANRLLTSYAEKWDWADPQWDLIVFDAPDNQELSGVRMRDWDDRGGLVGDWLDRIPWKDGVWVIIDDSHFGVRVHDRGDHTYHLHVYLEMYDVSHSYDAEITDEYWDLGPAARSPGRAAGILLEPVRTWVFDGNTEWTGRIANHDAFMWGGRPW